MFTSGDTEVAAGQVWTDASGKCDPYLQQAYSELYKGFEGEALKNITRTLYGNVPAYTSYINPRTLGGASVSEPTQHPLWERSSAGSVAITNAVPNVGRPARRSCGLRRRRTASPTERWCSSSASWGYRTT